MIEMYINPPKSDNKLKDSFVDIAHCVNWFVEPWSDITYIVKRHIKWEVINFHAVCFNWRASIAITCVICIETNTYNSRSDIHEMYCSFASAATITSVFIQWTPVNQKNRRVNNRLLHLPPMFVFRSLCAAHIFTLTLQRGSRQKTTLCLWRTVELHPRYEQIRGQGQEVKVLKYHGVTRYVSNTKDLQHRDQNNSLPFVLDKAQDCAINSTFMGAVQMSRYHVWLVYLWRPLQGQTSCLYLTTVGSKCKNRRKVCVIPIHFEVKG